MPAPRVTALAPRCARARVTHPWMALVLALALVWAQMLGLAHGVRHAHGPMAHPVHGAHAAHAGGAHTPTHWHVEPAHAAAEHHRPQSLLEHLAAPEGAADDCRLYDQLGHGGPVAVPLIAALTQASPLTPAWVVLQALQPRPCVAFAARAPPTSR
ncbi:hypothetical protein ACLBKS_02110 [Hylemonella sp. W303a]|uniref:hypothetical protein n=1 Tax=Hylemonella sp. W303a TaxID=3389873 RepID=UPI00396B1AFE